MTLELPQSEQLLVIDVHGPWFKDELIPLIEQNFPNRAPYWSGLALFGLPSNDSYQILTWADCEECYGYWDDEAKLAEILSGEYVLQEEEWTNDIAIVIWALVKKELLVQPTIPILFKIWW